jgi:hypothetical protein
MGPIADVGEVYFNVCFEEVKRKSSRSLVTFASGPIAVLDTHFSRYKDWVGDAEREYFSAASTKT